MGRRQISATVLRARAEANGYKRGAHVEKDQVKNQNKHNSKTKRNHDNTLRRYVLWQLSEIEHDRTKRDLPIPSEDEVHAQYLHEGVEAPDLATLKDFFRFYIATSTPQLSDTTTVDSMNSIAEFFFAAFTRATKTHISEVVRSEIYNWHRKVLVAEGLLVNRRRPKHNFTLQDLTRILSTLWTKDDCSFIPERYRVQFTYIIRVFCWTGARIGAFFTNGLRYRDVEMVLRRTQNNQWKLIYKIDQRWVKNNRDPENIVFGTALQEHDRFVYDDTAFLLSMAITDRALFGFDTLADLQTQRIPDGENQVVLRWRDSALEKPILRKCTKAGGVTDEFMPQRAFEAIFRNTLRNAGYASCGASVHSIRRQLGKKVDELYTEVQRSQQLTQADPRIFGQSYVANTSSVDGQGAFLGEATEHDHIDYFQSLERYYEPGLPCELPIQLEQRLKHDPKLLVLKAEAQRSELKKDKQQLNSYWQSLKRTALRQFQQQWVKERRDWKVITRGSGQSSDSCRTDLASSLSLLFPERYRLAQRITSGNTVNSEERWLAMEDLHTLCTRDFSVLYLPGHQPVHGNCPVKCCQTDLTQLKNPRRNNHVQACIRREIASRREQLQSHVHYCHHCFNWVVGPDEWEKHCQSHLRDWSSKRCGTITYCHTLVRPGYCPFCLGDTTLSAAQRLSSWCRDHDVWQHVHEHLRQRTWPVACPHPLCNVSISEERDLSFHFIDEHGFSRTIPKNVDTANTSSLVTNGSASLKRKAFDDGSEISWLPCEVLPPTSPPTKRTKKETRPSTVVPRLLSCMNEQPNSVRSSPDTAMVHDSATDVEGVAIPDPMRDFPSSLHLESFQSSDTTVMDSPYEDVFLQFVRSPSPDDLLPSFATPGGPPTLGEGSEANACSTTSSTAMASCRKSQLHEPSGASKEPHSIPRIRLLVKPPNPKITLRISVPTRAQSTKGRHPRQKRFTRRKKC